MCTLADSPNFSHGYQARRENVKLARHEQVVHWLLIGDGSRSHNVLDPSSVPGLMVLMVRSAHGSRHEAHERSCLGHKMMSVDGVDNGLLSAVDYKRG
jgi:hypothetical protein